MIYEEGYLVHFTYTHIFVQLSFGGLSYMQKKYMNLMNDIYLFAWITKLYTHECVYVSNTSRVCILQKRRLSSL